MVSFNNEKTLIKLLLVPNKDGRQFFLVTELNSKTWVHDFFPGGKSCAAEGLGSLGLAARESFFFFFFLKRGAKKTKGDAKSASYGDNY